MNCQFGWNQCSVIWSQFYGVVEIGMQVKFGRVRGGISWEWKFFFNVWVQNFNVDFFYYNGL